MHAHLAADTTHMDMQLSPTTQHDRVTHDFYPLTNDAQRAIDAIEYITEHLKQDEEYKMVILTHFVLPFVYSNETSL